MPRTVATVLLIAIVLALAIFVSTDIDTLLSILFLGLAIFWWGSVITLRFTRSNEPKILLDLGAPVSSVFRNDHPTERDRYRLDRTCADYQASLLLFLGVKYASAGHTIFHLKSATSRYY